MSSTNFDVEKSISYDWNYRHYIPTYVVSVPYYKTKAWNDGWGGHFQCGFHEVSLSFDEGQETTVTYNYYKEDGTARWNYEDHPLYDQTTNPNIPDSGVFSKVYFRNPHRNEVTFNASNCLVQARYNTKAAFQIQFNATGFAANQNATFRASTVQKSTPQQYTWSSATVYYKKSTDGAYSSAAGTISGTWSDYTISTNISLQDGYTYNIYITAVSDDGQTASTAVGNFSTTDVTAVATCIAPVGSFEQENITFVWSHSTAYGTPQRAYDLQYSDNNGGTWTTVASHVVTQSNTTSTTISNAGVYLWRVRTYNSNDVAGEWAQATFVNNVPATPPTNLQVTTKGRPTVTWASVSQAAYQIQFLLSGSIVYDSGAIYSAQTSHFVNQYFNDERSYTVRLRIYNALGEVTEWVETGYQQPSVSDISFTVTKNDDGGAFITITPADVFTKYYLLRNNKLIAQFSGTSYADIYAVGSVNYSVVAVTSDDQSDIQTKGIQIKYPHASITTLDGQQLLVNKRVDNAYEIQTTNEADVNKVSYIGDYYPTHYPSKMQVKSFTVNCFDDQNFCDLLLGSIVFYADNFGNGGYCIVKNYEKTDNFIKNSQGIYANEVSLRLEVTNYDDSIEYPL